MVVAKARPNVWDEEIGGRSSTARRRNGATARGVAKRTARVSTSAVAATALTALLAAGTLLSFVALRMEAVRVGYEVNAAREELAALRSENERLNLTLERLKSLDRIERVAREKLGFVKPSTVKYVDAGEIEVPPPTAPVREVGEAPRHGLWAAVSRRVGGWVSCVTVGLASQFVARWFCSIP